MRDAAVIAMVGGLALIGDERRNVAADSQTNVQQNSQMGFVVSHIKYALSKDANETGACPEGMTKGYGDAGGFNDIGAAFVSKPDLQRKEGEVEDNMCGGCFTQAMSDPNTKNLCMNPELGKPDPNFKTVTGKNVPADGIDLDGQDSRINGKAAPNTCPHEDFRGMNGERGIDNQFFRLVGCSKSWQSTGQSNQYEIEMYTGAWGILITLKGAEDLRNAKDVEVGIYANGDPIQLSPTREALPNATYAIDQDPRFRATTHGRIVNGVLTTDPVDVRFHVITNSIHLERPLQDARLRMTCHPGRRPGWNSGRVHAGRGAVRLSIRIPQWQGRQGRSGAAAIENGLVHRPGGRAGAHLPGRLLRHEAARGRASRSQDRTVLLPFHAIPHQGDSRLRGRYGHDSVNKDLDRSGGTKTGLATSWFAVRYAEWF